MYAVGSDDPLPQVPSTQEVHDGAYFSLSPKKKKPGRDLSEKHMSPEQRTRFHAAKDTEWGTVSGAGAVKLLDLASSRKIRKTMADRIMKCRMLLDEKVEEGGTVREEARLILLGHLDPDLLRLVQEELEIGPT